MDDFNQTEDGETPNPVMITELAPAAPERLPRPERCPVDVESTPVRLRPLKQWVVWRYLWREGKWTKPPLLAGRYAREPDYPTSAKTNDPATWRDWSTAVAAYEASKTWNDPFDGIGFVFTGKVDEDGLTEVGFDWDSMTNRARAQCVRLNSYSELSPSRRGIHTIVRARPFKTVVCKSEELKAEAYSERRFFTFTGMLLEDWPPAVEDRPEEVAEIVAEIERLSGGRKGVVSASWAHLVKPGDGGRSRSKLIIYTPGVNDALGFPTPPEPLDLVKLSSAVMALPDELFDPKNTQWTNMVCRPLANEAARANDENITEQLYAMLDARSKLDSANYDPEANRERFDRCMKDYGKVTPPILSGSIYKRATDNGWNWTQPGPNPGPDPSFDLKSISNLSLKPPPRAGAYGIWMMYGEVTLLGGPSSFGKTALGVVISLACASGRPLLGQKVFLGPQKTLHISSEEPTRELWRRYLAAALHHQVDQAHVGNAIFRGNDANNGRPIELMQMTSKGVAAVNPNGITLLEKLIDESGARIVLLDPLYSFLAGGLNDNSAMGALVHRLIAMAQAKEVAIVVMHHPSKGRDPESNEAFMGASTIVFAVRSAITIVRASAEEALETGALPGDGLFRIFHGKPSYSKPQDEEQWYWQRSVNLDNATPEYPKGDSVGVIETYDPASIAGSGPDRNHMRIMLRVIADPPFGLPLSPTTQSDQNYRKPVRSALKQAGVPMRQKGDDANAVVDRLLDALKVAECVREAQVTGSGRNKVKGLVVTEKGRKWLDGEVTLESEAAPERASTVRPRSSLWQACFEVARKRGRAAGCGLHRGLR